MSETFNGVFVNAKTGETVERELTSDEAAYLLSLQESEQILNAEAQAKVEVRQSALAKLAALGLTEEEVAAL
jgi:hypothetical protein